MPAMAMDGYVSLEVWPHRPMTLKARSAKPSRYARWWIAPTDGQRAGDVGGDPANEQLIVDGLNINVTSMSSMADYEAVARAHRTG